MGFVFCIEKVEIIVFLFCLLMVPIFFNNAECFAPYRVSPYIMHKKWFANLRCFDSFVLWVGTGLGFGRPDCLESVVGLDPLSIDISIS